MSDSPTLRRGSTSRSNNSVRKPASATSAAAVDPRGPPPTTIQSYSFDLGCITITDSTTHCFALSGPLRVVELHDFQNLHGGALVAEYLSRSPKDRRIVCKLQTLAQNGPRRDPPQRKNFH